MGRRRGLHEPETMRQVCERLRQVTPVTEPALLAVLPNLVPLHPNTLRSVRRHPDTLLRRLIDRGVGYAFDLALDLHAGNPIARGRWVVGCEDLRQGAAAARVLRERHPDTGQEVGP